MAGYTRQSTFTDGDIINAADSNDEFDQLVNVFANTTGHKHDGTASEGPVIGLIGDPGIATPLNKVVVDDTNNQVEFNIDVSGTSTEQFVVKDGVIEPTTDNDIDLGSSSKEFKDLYIDGVAYLDSVAMPTTTVTDILDEDNMSSNSATALATQQSIKAYVDATVTAQDLDFQADSGGALNIDLDSEVLTLTGGTGIDTTGSSNTVTFAIDSTVATLAGSQTLTNKTLTAPIIATISNSGTLTLPTSSDTLVGRATSDTFTNKTFDANGTGNSLSNVEVADFASGVLDTDLSSVAATDTTLASAKAIKTYVDAQVTASDLDFEADSGGALSIDLDSETMTFTGGTGIDTSGSGNAVTFAIDSTVATLAGTQTLTNKSIDASQLTGTVANARLDQQLQDVAGLAVTNGNFIVGDGSNFVAESGATARASLGLTIGTDVQAYDAQLADVAGLTPSDGNIIVGDGSNFVAESGATARASLGLTIGTDVQAYDAQLADVAGLTPSDGNIIVGDGSNFVAESGATARASLGLTIGTHVQAYDAQLADVAGLTPSDGNIIIGDGSNFVAESGSTARASLGLTIGTDVQAYDAELAALAGLTSAADKGIQFTGSGTAGTFDLTAAGKALLDDADASAQRTTLGLGTAATQTVGTSANNVVQLDGSARLPAVDGSQLTNVSGTGGGATGGGSDEVFYENGQTVTTNYTITNGKNAMSAGPITINSGITVTVGSGETWTVV